MGDIYPFNSRGAAVHKWLEWTRLNELSEETCMRKQLVLRLGLGVSLLVFAANSTLLAQVGTEGAILGVVKDSSGAVIAGAEVTVTNVDTNLKKMVVTDSGGNFEVLALPRGFYSVAASLTGFKTWLSGEGGIDSG